MRTHPQIRIVRPAELEPLTPADHWGVDSRFIVRQPVGLVFQFCEMEPGGGAESHVHEGQEQIFFVLSGRLRVAAGGGCELTVSEGEALLIPAGAAHGTANGDPEPARYLVLTYPSSPDDWSYPVSVDTSV